MLKLHCQSFFLSSGVIFASPTKCPFRLSVSQSLTNQGQQLGTRRALDVEIVSKPNLPAMCYSSGLIGEDWQPQMGTRNKMRFIKVGGKMIMQTAERKVWDGPSPDWRRSQNPVKTREK